MTLSINVSVESPYRLDLTVDALRRLAANVVDVASADGAYRRVLNDDAGANALEVRQASGRSLEVKIAGRKPERWIPVVRRMLGVDARLDEWYARVLPFPWLAFLTRELRGLRPPQYPTLFEALAHSIVFQQISIHAAASIMRRTVEALSAPVDAGGERLYPFFRPIEVLNAPEPALRAAGLSTNKVAHLRSAASAILEGAISREQIDALPSPEAALRFATVRGIGPWSAAVVLLRGLGRLDVFPLKDSGVARSIKSLAGDQVSDASALLDALGPVRGMLYFHLLLGRMRNLTPPEVNL